MSKNKIGEILEINEDFTIETALSNTPMVVKKGDKGFVDSRGNINYINGAARGKMQHLKDCELKGYDNASIANIICNRLRAAFNIDDLLDNEGIEYSIFKEVIEEALDDILK